jgi:regulatory protein
MNSSPSNRAYQTALHLLARREHSRVELNQKLMAKKYAELEIQAALTALAERNLQSDKRFAECYLRSRQQKGVGPLKIRQELGLRGISKEIIAELVQMADNAWFKLVRECWRRHFKGKKPENAPERAKQARFLTARGFTRDHINSLIKDSNDDYDEDTDFI